MIIREANLNDCEALDGLLTKLIRYESRYNPNLRRDYVVTDNYSGRLGEAGHKAFIAEDDGKIAGFIYGFVYEIPGMFLEPVAILDALYVEEDYRHTGVAKELFRRFQKFAEAGGACRIELKVLTDNENALRFYESLGFAETTKYMSLTVKRHSDRIPSDGK